MEEAHGRRRLRPHGRLLAGDVGELVGVSGTTIGQWARRGYIRSSQSEGEPRVYSVEDVGEAAVVAELLARGVRHADVRATLARLADVGPWPLSEVELATTEGDGRPRVVLREAGTPHALTPRGWQLLAVAPALRAVPLRLRRTPFVGGDAG
ncbi:MAG: MerR family transcriptional regulator [Actinomycetota bacterium]|nr:MerR family transcriptional regulator [Actinomycetota bacterium]